MKITKIHIQTIVTIIIIVAILVVFQFVWDQKYINFELFNQYAQYIIKISNQNYWLSVLFYITSYAVIKIAALPVAIFFNILAGFLYGLIPGTLYNIIAVLIGSSTTFVLFRHLLGESVQKKYSSKLVHFNKNIEQYGSIYLIAITLIGMIPSFLTNVLASLTKVSLHTFVYSILIGIIPGSLIYSYVGSGLTDANLIKNVLSIKILIALYSVKFIGFIILITKNRFNKKDIDELNKIKL